jgi:hypothetical protein
VRENIASATSALLSHLGPIALSHLASRCLDLLVQSCSEPVVQKFSEAIIVALEVSTAQCLDRRYDNPSHLILTLNVDGFLHNLVVVWESRTESTMEAQQLPDRTSCLLYSWYHWRDRRFIPLLS